MNDNNNNRDWDDSNEEFVATHVPAHILDQDRDAVAANLNKKEPSMERRFTITPNDDSRNASISTGTAEKLHNNPGLARRVPADQHHQYADKTPADMKAAVDAIHRDSAATYLDYVDDCRANGIPPARKHEWEQVKAAAHQILTH